MKAVIVLLVVFHYCTRQPKMPHLLYPFRVPLLRDYGELVVTICFFSLESQLHILINIFCHSPEATVLET